MDMIELPDGLRSLIERQVADGKAASPAAFLEEAVRRLLDDAGIEEAEIHQVVEAGRADIDSGHFRMVTTPDDAARLGTDLMARLQARLSLSR